MALSVLDGASLELAVKILPELINIRPEEKESIKERSRILKEKLKPILSKDINKEVKESLEKNKSIPAEIRKELGLAAISDDIV